MTNRLRPWRAVVATLPVLLRLLGATGELLQFDQPVQGGDVSDRESGMVGLAVGAVGLLPTGEARREQIAGGPDEEQVVGRVAAGFDEVRAAFQLGQVAGDGGAHRG